MPPRHINYSQLHIYSEGAAGWLLVAEITDKLTIFYSPGHTVECHGVTQEVQVEFKVVDFFFIFVMF